MIARVASLLKIKQPDMNRGLLIGSGTVVPADATDGWQTGAIFAHTDGGAGTCFYINEGTVTSSAFVAVAGLTAAQEALLSATAGTVTADKAVIVDSSKNAATFGNVGAATVTAPVLVMTGTTGAQEVRLTTNLADALSIEDTAGDILVVATTTGSQLVTITPATTVSGAFTASTSVTTPVVVMTGTTGNQEIRLTTNLADALSIESSAGDIAVFKTTTNAVEIDIAKEVVLQCGAFASSYATGSATVFTSAITAVGRFYGESTSDLTSAVNARTIVARHLIVTASATVAHETYGLIGQVCVKNTTLTHLHAGVMGTFEVSTAATVNGAYAYGVGAVEARLGVGTSILTCTKPISAFSAVYNGGALASGDSVAFSACSATATKFTHFLAADSCDNFFYAATGTAYESGVKITAITNVSTTASGVLRVKVGATLYYIPLWAAAQLDGE